MRIVGFGRVLVLATAGITLAMSLGVARSQTNDSPRLGASVPPRDGPADRAGAERPASTLASPRASAPGTVGPLAADQDRDRMLGTAPLGANLSVAVGSRTEPRPSTPRDASSPPLPSPSPSPPRQLQARLPEPSGLLLCGMGLAILFALTCRRHIHRLNAAT